MKTKIFSAIAALAIIFLATLGSPAGAAVFSNGDFETVPTNPWLAMDIGSWNTAAGNAPAFHGLAGGDPAGAWPLGVGTNYAEVGNPGSWRGGIFQSFDTVIGATYSLNFWGSNWEGQAIATGYVSVGSGTWDGITGTGDVGTVNTSLIPQDELTIQTLNIDRNALNTFTNTNNNWNYFTFTFTATSTQSTISVWNNVGSAIRVDNFFIDKISSAPIEWAGAASGNYSDGTQWIGGTAPNGPGEAALFGWMATQPTTVTIDVPVTLGNLKFDNYYSYDIQGSNAITLSGTNGGASTITVVYGKHTIEVPLVIVGAPTISIADELTIAGGIDNAAAKPIEINGTGSLHLNSAITNSANTPVTINGTIVNFNAGPIALKSLDLKGGTTNGAAISAGAYTSTGGTFNNALGGTGGLTINGGTSETVTLGTANTFSGDTLVNGGRLMLNHVDALQNSPTISLARDTSAINSTGMPFTLRAPQTLTGLGTFQSDITTVSGASFTPGTDESDLPYYAFTPLTVSGNLTSASGTKYNFTRGVIDQWKALWVMASSLKVTGTADFTAGGSVINLSIPTGAFLDPGTYTVIDAAGGVTGTPVLGPMPDAGLRNPFTMTTTATTVDIVVGPQGDLDWTGATNSNWSTNTADVNWSDTTVGATSFYKWDNVRFTDTGIAAGATTVNVVGTVEPRSITFSHTSGNYTLQGGDIATGGSLLQDGIGGTVTIKNQITLTTPYYEDTGVVKGGIFVSNGNMVVSTGGVVNVSGFVLGPTAGDVAEAAIDDPTAVINVDTAFMVGRSGQATFTQSAGTVNVSLFAAIGQWIGSKGIYNMTGGTLNAGLADGGWHPFFISLAGDGDLNMSGSAVINVGDSIWSGGPWGQTGDGHTDMKDNSQINVANFVAVGMTNATFYPSALSTWTMTDHSKLTVGNYLSVADSSPADLSMNSYAEITVGGNFQTNNTANLSMIGNTKLTVGGDFLLANGGAGNLSMDGNAQIIKNGGGWFSLGHWGSASTNTMAGDSSITSSACVNIGAGGNVIASLTMNGTAHITATANDWGSFNVGRWVDSYGTLEMTENSYITFSKGNFNIANTDRAKGEVILRGASHIDGTADFIVGNNMGWGDGYSTAYLTLYDSAALTIPTGTLLVANAAGTPPSGYGMTGVVNMEGGTITANALRMSNWGSTSATVNLNGGVIAVNSVSRGDGASAVINFNGGTLMARSNNPTFLQGLNAANVLTGGAKFDTNGFDISIAQNLVGNVGDGGLTKLGAGILTLTGTLAYKGDTTVNEGTLVLTTALDTPTAAVYVATGATLTAPSITSDSLTIGGAPKMAFGAVPEPGTLMLLVLAGAALFGVYLRRR